MRVEVTRILDASEGLVSFRCALGHATARWAGSTPLQLGEFDVEFDIPEEITRWIVLTDPAPGSIAGDVEEETGVSLTGTVVDVGEGDDPVVSIRLGSDIVMIEAPDRKWDVTPGDGVSMQVPVIRMYPYFL
ncbi:hypothetical protein ACFW1A_20430 [Kitasatospora sp. NPDC058965]|uniref:hypothetical protein n=1 Tax=Kitasatospora sp. NPDC058965 TaxID=3346682 RepID=UPI00367B9638